MIDLTRLTPAPWECGRVLKESEGRTSLYFCEQVEIYPPSMEEAGLDFQPGGPVAAVSVAEFADNAEFIALARNAFDVMLRRGWTAVLHNGRWFVSSTTENLVPIFENRVSAPIADPFTCLVEADAWYTANIEDKKS